MYVYPDSTLEEWFSLTDPNYHYWHIVGNVTLDDIDTDATFSEVLGGVRTIVMQRRDLSPWWTLPEDIPENLEFELQDGTSWHILYGRTL